MRTCDLTRGARFCTRNYGMIYVQLAKGRMCKVDANQRKPTFNKRLTNRREIEPQAPHLTFSGILWYRDSREMKKASGFDGLVVSMILWVTQHSTGASLLPCCTHCHFRRFYLYYKSLHPSLVVTLCESFLFFNYKITT